MSKFRISKVQRSTVPRNRRLRRKKKTKGYNVKAGKELVTYMVPRQMPFPPRYRTKFTCAITGGIAIGAASGHYYAQLNAAYLPFSGGGWTGVLTSNITTLQPAGFTQLCNLNLYKNCRVYGSKIEMEFLPQALTDTVEVTVTPSGLGAQPATVALAMEMPYTKSHFMSSSKMNSSKGSLISNYITQHKYLGVTKRAIEDDLSGNYIHTYAGNCAIPLIWVINWAAPDAAAMTTVLEYRVIMTYYCELFNATNNTFTTT